MSSQPCLQTRKCSTIIHDHCAHGRPFPRGPNHRLERRRGCASRCAAASTVNSGRVAPVIITHFEAATCCTAAVYAAALRKAAAASDDSQLRKRGRKAAGASIHRPLRSMSRCVSDAPFINSPHRQRRRDRELKSPFFFTELRVLTELQTGNRPEPCPTVFAIRFLVD